MGTPIPPRTSRGTSVPIGRRQYPATQAEDEIQEGEGEVFETGEDEAYTPPSRLPRSALRYRFLATDQPQVITQGSRRFVLHQGPPPTWPASAPHQRHSPSSGLRLHWLVYVGLFLLLMLTSWVLVTLLLSWWQSTQDDWQFGRPRTFQVDQRVGHNDSQTPSHFLALNLNHQVQIIECPASDCTKAVIYTGPQLYGEGNDLTPVTLSFKDVNGDGKLDMLVHVGNQTFVFINEAGKFRPARPDEHLSL
jgi:hypothetical protein